MALKPFSHVTSGPAEPAADVEDVLVGLDRKAIREFDGCGIAAGMKMIDGRQILDGQALHALHQSALVSF